MRCDPVEIDTRPRTAGLVCVGCGCTDDNACPGGCYWVSIDPPRCSSCAARPLSGADALFGIEEQADLATADGVNYGADRCRASPTPALHAPIFVDNTSGYCARCKIGFVL